jgi:hypothetical protein
MATLEAGRVRTVGLVVALAAACIGAAACAKKEQAPSADASLSAAAAVEVTPTTGTTTELQPPPETCFHYDGSEYVCPFDRATPEAQRDRLLASGTVIDSGSITLRTGGRVITLDLPKGRKLDAIFLTPKGVQLLEDHYRYDRPHKPEYLRRADSLRTFIATFGEP